MRFRYACAWLFVVAWPLLAAATSLPPNVDADRKPQYDEALGLPRLVWGRAAARPAAVAAKPASSATVLAAARAELAKLASLYTLDAVRLATAEAVEVRTEPGRRLVRFAQRIDGLPVVHRELVLSLDDAGQLVLATGNLSPHSPSGAFTLDAADALGAAWRDLTGGAPAPRGQTRTRIDGWQDYTVAASAPRGWRVSSTPRLRRVYHAQPATLVAAWQVELNALDAEGRESAYEYLVAADDGRVLERRSLTSSAAHGYRVWAQTTGDLQPMDGPGGDVAFPHPTGVPDGSVITPVAPNFVTVDATTYRPTRPWIDVANGSTLDGTRVIGFVDLDGGGFNGSDDLVGTAPSGNFDFAWDPALQPDATHEQARAALTHAFYLVNHLADWFYPGGFDEAGGNHQRDNFGLGGAGNDPLELQTLDADAVGDANAMTPADGQSPRIQMGVFTGDISRSLEVAGDQGFALSRDRTGTGSAGAFGPLDFDLQGEFVIAVDGAGFDAFDLCEAPTNGADMVGRIAVVRRGNCTFADKVFRAQQAGAIAALVTNHLPADHPNGGVLQMGGASPDVTIPALFVSMEDGTAIRAALAAAETLTARLRRDGGVGVDTSIESSILAHEWGHVLVARNVNLAAPGPGMGTQPQGLNEGTADFVALLYLAGPEGAATQYAGAYPVGAYLQSAQAVNGAYFGFRRYPYSADMAKSPLSFGHIGATATLPPDVPRHDTNGEPHQQHNVGEVWAVTLWDGYVGLLNSGRYTHAQARDQMRDYLVAMLKRLPDNPTLLEARDVMLAFVLTQSPQDHAVLATAFAKRGMGLDAVGPAVSSETNAGITESFIVIPTPGLEPDPGDGGGGDDEGDEAGGGGAAGLLLLIALGVLRVRRFVRWSDGGLRKL